MSEQWGYEEVAAWVDEQGQVRVSDLQRRLKIGYFHAHQTLEEMEDAGLLEKATERPPSYRAAHLRERPGLTLDLTPKEHGALLRLLDWCLSDPDTEEHAPGDNATLRTIRNRLKRPA